MLVIFFSGFLIKLHLILNLCFDFGYENILVYNAKNAYILSLLNCAMLQVELTCIGVIKIN